MTRLRSRVAAAAARAAVLAASVCTAAAGPSVTVAVGGQWITVEQHGLHAVRVRAVPAGLPVLDEPDIVSALLPLDRAGRRASPLQVVSAPANFTAGNLRVQIERSGIISFVRLSDGRLLLREAMPRRFGVPAVTSTKLPGFMSLALQFAPQPEERIYGLGQHKNGHLEYKGWGGQLQLAPQNTEILVPVAHSSRGYAFLLNAPGFGTVQFNQSGSSWNLECVKQADFWLSTTADGPDHAVSPWQQLQAAYADATGHAPVYPDWSTGFWQCKNR